MIKLLLFLIVSIAAYSYSYSEVVSNPELNNAWTELMHHLPKYPKNEVNVLIFETKPYVVSNGGDDLWDGLDILILQTILSKLNLKTNFESTKDFDSISQEYLE